MADTTMILEVFNAVADQDTSQVPPNMTYIPGASTAVYMSAKWQRLALQIVSTEHLTADDKAKVYMYTFEKNSLTRIRYVFYHTGKSGHTVEVQGTSIHVSHMRKCSTTTR
jgi:hypothetical protein